MSSSNSHSGKITVFMVDRNAFFRQGVRVTLSGRQDIEVLGESDVAEDAFELIQMTVPQVVLVDVTPPAFSGIDLTRRVVQTLQDTKVAVMTPYLNEDEIVMATTAGASAYLSRYITASELLRSIERVANGELLLVDTLLAKPHLLERVLRCFRDLSLKGRAADPVNAPITDRETEILSYVARGFGNKQIAHALNISEQTIKNHMTSILRKLDASDRTHAVVMAMQSGWISTTERYEPGQMRNA
ncbi:MAG: response regulator transcription factor [Chloroflexi bacterium]|nr:response regulator transcription factor [Chloroflexota bacterium]